VLPYEQTFGLFAFQDKATFQTTIDASFLEEQKGVKSDWLKLFPGWQTKMSLILAEIVFILKQYEKKTMEKEMLPIMAK
jgi:hypothetical protein